MSKVSRVWRCAVGAAALVLLNVSLTFVNLWPTPAVSMTRDLSIETGLCVLGIVVAAACVGPISRVALRRMAVLWVALVVGRYVDVTARSLYGRELNLYWDLRHMPDVGAMLAFVAKPWQVAAVVVSAVVLPVLLYVPLRWALGQIGALAQHPIDRRALGILAGGTLLVGAVQSVGAPLPAAPRAAELVTALYLRQAAQLAYQASGAGVRALPDPPSIRTNLAHVAGADVFLVFLESYGAVSWDCPVFARALAESRTRLEHDIRDTGRDVVSARVESSTFGGESWLAHISLLSGTEVRDAGTNARLMAQQRDTMVTAFSRRGYRTVAVMPGLQHAWPEGDFYGFDDIIDTARLGYQGPSFGWWDVTDQFALASMDALAVAPRDRPPVFVFFPTISTHTPFTPTPPYQPDWTRVLTDTPYDQADLDRAWSGPPDWLNLGPGYTQSLDYAHALLGGYLRLRADRDFVMVLVGDHQPPAMVSGEGAAWDVPVHVIASRREVLDRLVQRGFVSGLTPPSSPIGKMHALMPVLLEGFGD